MMKFPLRVTPRAVGANINDASDRHVAYVVDLATAERIVALANEGHRVEQITENLKRADERQLLKAVAS